MRWAAWLMIFLSGSTAFAQKLNYARQLARAKSVVEVRNIQARFEQLQIATRACKMQLTAGSAPTACYESLKLEIAWGLHPQAKQRRLRDRLDSICSEAAQKFSIPKQVPPEVSAKCRAEILAANRILTYRENSPAWSEN